MDSTTADDEAAVMVAAVRDDSARRLELAARFYDRRPGRPSIRSYRRAELAFMRWQMTRGTYGHGKGTIGDSHPEEPDQEHRHGSARKSSLRPGLT